MTKVEIKKRLLKTKGLEFDSRLDIDKRVDRIFDKDEDKHEMYVEFFGLDHMRTVVKEFKYMTLTVGSYEKNFKIHKIRKDSPFGEDGTWMDLLNFYVDTQEEALKIVEEYNQIYENQYTETNINFPSGELIFSNYFLHNDKYLIKVDADKEYAEDYSICHAYGEQKTMKHLAKKGLSYAQLSNTTAGIYKVSNDKIVIGPDFPILYVDVDDYEKEFSLPGGYEYMGSISCSVWRTECIDMEDLKKTEFDLSTLEFPKSNCQYSKNIKVNVTPGEWHVKVSHHFKGDNERMVNGEFPVWVEMSRIK